MADYGRLAGAQADVAVTAADDRARLGGISLNVVAIPTGGKARLSGLIVDVILRLPPPSNKGIWPQERLDVMPGIQGQRLKRHKGQP